MAYVNGIWEDENANVAPRIAGMLASDSPLLKAAQTTAAQSASP